jgi:hypothetical protein
MSVMEESNAEVELEKLEEEIKEENENLRQELEEAKKEMDISDIKNEFRRKLEKMKENGNKEEKAYANKVLEEMDAKKTLKTLKDNIIRYTKPKNNLSKDINKEYKIAEDKLKNSTGFIFRHIGKVKSKLKESNDDRLTNTEIKYFLWEFYKFVNRNSLDEYGVFITEAINYIYKLEDLNEDELDSYYNNVKEVVELMN